MACVPSCTMDNKLRIGFLSNLTHSQVLCMCMDEYFYETCDAEMYAFNAGPSIMESMRSRQINIACIGPVPAISGYVSSGGNIRIIAGASMAGSMLVTRQGLVLTNVDELSGMTVAVPQFGNTQDVILRRLLEGAGLSSAENGGTVEIIQQDNANIKNLLLKGDIDAALVPEPWGTRLAEEANANILLDHDSIFDGNYPASVLIVRADYLEEHRDEVKLFLKEYIGITERINSDNSWTVDTVNSALKRLTGVAIEKDILKESLDRIKVDYNIGSDMIELFMDMCVEQGLISEKIPAEELLDTSLLDEILSEIRN